jgi:hypothetical protein
VSLPYLKDLSILGTPLRFLSYLPVLLKSIYSVKTFLLITIVVPCTVADVDYLSKEIYCVVSEVELQGKPLLSKEFS